MTEKATKDGKDMTVAVLAAESPGTQWNKPGANHPVVINAGEVLVFVDVVTAKAVQQQTVEMKAADIADALATKGMIDLYGIRIVDFVRKRVLRYGGRGRICQTGRTRPNNYQDCNKARGEDSAFDPQIFPQWTAQDRADSN